MNEHANPLIGSVPEEIPLARAPLVRVIAQVKFPLVASIEKRDFIASFQEEIRPTYPVLRQERGYNVAVGPSGADVQPSTIWRFGNQKGDWRVSLGPTFFALETTSYVSRDDFVARIKRLSAAIASHIEPALVDRIGTRYIDRIELNDVSQVCELVRTEMAGVLASVAGQHATQALAETRFSLEEEAGELVGRWGLVPANATVDPAAIDPIACPSWILDLDAFSEQSKPFDIESIAEETDAFAKRIYSFFRWAVTENFIEMFRG